MEENIDPPSQHFRVILIQAGSEITVEATFDVHGIRRGREYALFKSLTPRALELIKPGAPQLILSSRSNSIHPEFHVNPHFVAEKVKKINPEALVFAYTSETMQSDETTRLDGIIPKM